MNTNLRKFLYLGAGMLLFALALTQFFVNYHSYQAYVDTSINMSQQDRVVTVLEDNPCTYVHGYDLIHLILEEQKRVGLEKLTRNTMMSSLPFNAAVPYGLAAKRLT